MSDGGRPDPLARLDATAEAVAALRDIFAAEEPLDDVLARVAGTAARAIPDADAVSITVLTGDSPRTAAYTDERILELDRSQYESGRGPCIESARHQRPVHVEIGDGTTPWPEFAEAARRSGIRASLSVPLLVGDDQPEIVGSLNVYSYTAPAFDPFDEGLMRLYTASAGQAITNARRWQQSRDTIAHLERALTSRAVIDQAKGALMAVHGCTAEQAFGRLVEESQRRNIKVHDIARELMASLTTNRR
ncbi:transcriptional regulator [Mycolicibacterium doricum]|uniref:Response regulator receiver protein n=1 Tax=Mycolicibacterium doricum TaxID=126673 RepID=A0A1X1TAU9_9MYCO|nr:GAF and ANTAR domain-containing protein [Mycolicibacterium doricum]MCV7269158.1 GAF and ANTAR domain-containing protein [Mycolicibacterium doricum]ORV41639.1 response regulator receiver protein [Mycolicibacterium doricum]BBZ06369.1 transcriptional regulator [Mycolicibacterium doricum]